MLPFLAKIYVYEQTINMQNSFSGLVNIIEKAFPGVLFAEALFLFFNRKKDSLKLLYWDGDGFVIFYKRLEKGIFARSQKTMLTRREFFLLLEGISPRHLQRRFSL